MSPVNSLTRALLRRRRGSGTHQHLEFRQALLEVLRAGLARIEPMHFDDGRKDCGVVDEGLGPRAIRSRLKSERCSPAGEAAWPA